MKNIIKSFAAFAAVAMTVMTACDKDNSTTPTGSSTVTIGGGDGSETYDKCLVQIAEAGQTPIEGLYATWFDIRFEKSTNSNAGISMMTVLFHSSPTLAAGRYTFPSTGTGTAYGRMGANGFGGYIVSGTLDIAISGKTYTVTLTDAMYDDVSGKPGTFGFRYSGGAHPTDNHSYEEAPLPEYGGKSTLVEAVSGLAIPNVNFTIHNMHEGPKGGYFNMLQLKAAVDGTNVTMEFCLYSAEPTMAGIYTAAHSSTDDMFQIGRFDGYMKCDKDGDSLFRQFHSGTLALSWSAAGLYTITLSDITGWSDWPEPGQGERLELAGTVTAYCNEFYGYD